MNVAPIEQQATPNSEEELQDILVKFRNGTIDPSPKKWGMDYNDLGYATDAIMQLIQQEVEKAKEEARITGKLDAVKHLKKYMISTSPFIARIVDPYIEELSKLQEEQK